MEAADILILVAHPSMEHSRLNRRLMQAASQGNAGPLPRFLDPLGGPDAKRQVWGRSDAGTAADGRIQVRDLYALYPDYLIDVEAEQAAVARARLVVWQHPIHWYGMPPLMKLWLDSVLAFGWAYGPDGSALRGKDLWLVASTGGPEDSYRPDSYNRYFFDAFLPPYEQTAALCGMRFLAPLLLHGAHRVSHEEIDAHAALYADRLATYPAWPELDDLEQCPDCIVPSDTRPVDDESDGVPALKAA